MVLLGQQPALVRHRGASRRTAYAALAVLAVFCTVAAVLVARYNERPPWGTDIAYEGGYIMAVRIVKPDRTGLRAGQLLAGECARMERDGMGGDRARHDPEAWVAGCLDGAAKREPVKQGLLY
ncbi:hypothetical protein ABT160_44795 [Streptomyces sp. NPDC001941]|uniref:hypothetical protein n=1 Tax=Streptomyces sp. NPDC001941 TaxID=3154659 RepID=UPI00332C363F